MIHGLACCWCVEVVGSSAAACVLRLLYYITHSSRASKSQSHWFTLIAECYSISPPT